MWARLPDGESGARGDRGGCLDRLQPLLATVREDPDDEAAFGLQHALVRGQHLSTRNGEGLTERLREPALQALKLVFLFGHGPTVLDQD